MYLVVFLCSVVLVVLRIKEIEIVCVKVASIVD